MIDPAKLGRLRIVQDLGIDAKKPLPKDQDGTKVLTNVFDATEDSLFPLAGRAWIRDSADAVHRPEFARRRRPCGHALPRAVSAKIEREGRTGLSEDWVITPVGGSGKVPAFVALLAPQKGMNVATLLEIQNSDRTLIEDLYKKKLLKRKQVAIYAEFAGRDEADVEDMFEREFYAGLVDTEFAKQLKEPIEPSALNEKAPRTLRCDRGMLEDKPLKSGAFGHYRPARYFSEHMAELWPQVSDATKVRFEAAFKHLNTLLK